MATFEAQIESLTGLTIESSGTNPTQAQVTQFLRTAVTEVINRIITIKPDEISRFTLSTTSGSNAYVSALGKVAFVMREHNSTSILRKCTEIDPALQYEAADPDSLHYRTKYNPAFYRDSGLIYAVPTATDTSNNRLRVGKIVYDTSLAYSDDEDNILQFPSEYGYIVTLHAACSSLLNTMGIKANNLPNDLSIPALDSISTSLPVYTAPTAFLLPPSFANLDVDLSSIILPTMPSLSVNSISFSTSAPTYTGPTVAPDFGDANKWIGTEEDSEMSAARVQVIGAQLQDFQAKMQDELNNFNRQNAEYQAELQKSVQNAQLSSSDDSLAVQKYQAELGSYQAQISTELQKFQAETGIDISKYQADLQANGQKYQMDLTQNKTDFDSNLSKYMSEMQKVSTDNQMKITKFNSEVQDYASKLNKVRTDYEWLQGRYMILKQDYERAFAGFIPQATQSQQQEQRR